MFWSRLLLGFDVFNSFSAVVGFCSRFAFVALNFDETRDSWEVEATFP
jgi:hypothetical protein